jgi:molybdenum-dependent DNA-binding transcriptional regulator ModE
MKPWRKARRDFEIGYWTKTINDAGSISEAARRVGANRTWLQRLIKNLEIKSPRRYTPNKGRWGNLSH